MLSGPNSGPYEHTHKLLDVQMNSVEQSSCRNDFHAGRLGEILAGLVYWQVQSHDDTLAPLADCGLQFLFSFSCFWQ